MQCFLQIFAFFLSVISADSPRRGEAPGVGPSLSVERQIQMYYDYLMILYVLAASFSRALSAQVIKDYDSLSLAAVSEGLHFIDKSAKRCHFSIQVVRAGEKTTYTHTKFSVYFSHPLVILNLTQGVVCLASTSSSPTGCASAAQIHGICRFVAQLRARIQLRPTQRWEKVPLQSLQDE